MRDKENAEEVSSDQAQLFHELKLPAKFSTCREAVSLGALETGREESDWNRNSIVSTISQQPNTSFHDRETTTTTKALSTFCTYVPPGQTPENRWKSQRCPPSLPPSIRKKRPQLLKPSQMPERHQKGMSSRETAMERKR